MRITEPSNDDNNNDGSDNCGYNFVTFDDFGVKIMIVMSRYKGQLHGGKRVKMFGQGPPLFGQCPKENILFYMRCYLKLIVIYPSSIGF